MRGRVEEVLCLLKSASSYSCYNEGHFDVCLDLKLACFCLMYSHSHLAWRRLPAWLGGGFTSSLD